MSRHALLLLALVVPALAGHNSLEVGPEKPCSISPKLIKCIDEINKVLKKSVEDPFTCTNIDGSYTCTCKPGYEGDGRTCTKVCSSPNFQVGSECFYLSTDKLTWFSAQAACEALGGALAEPSNPRQVAAKIREIYQKSVFLGGSDLVRHGHWVGLSGRPFVTEGQWAIGEPNNKGGKEDCIAIYGGRRGLNDIPCEASSRYLCEM